MKFLSLLTFVSFALAAPSPRQQTVAGVIADSVSTLQVATQANIVEITQAVAAIDENTEADVVAELTAVVRANFEAIAQALVQATTSIGAVTSGAVGGVSGAALGFTRQQVDELKVAIETTTEVIADIGAAVTLTVTDLTPAVQAFVASEVSAVRTELNPFVDPLVIFGTAVQAATVGASVAISGLNAAVTQLITVRNSLTASLGLPLPL
ncbi:hypothetical protein FZEAL_10216 [Fusarium zealandicum]|uniref:Uncharacterized protein n=1 Tax=Fusarium zealandicum TaxID=1053134 RepID=A0A8H4XCU2_9HYPO|nr:hypothetical protein FZEAL_10216 [Fusarium zealandicum]